MEKIENLHDNLLLNLFKSTDFLITIMTLINYQVPIMIDNLLILLRQKIIQLNRKISKTRFKIQLSLWIILDLLLLVINIMEDNRGAPNHNRIPYNLWVMKKVVIFKYKSARKDQIRTSYFNQIRCIRQHNHKIIYESKK